MRIGFDATPLLGVRTGVGMYVAELVDALAGRFPDDELLLMPISWRSASGLQTPSDQPNVRILRRFAPARPLWELWHRMPFPPLEMLCRCDVFHAPNFLSPPAWRTPLVVTVHDLSFVRMPETCVPAVRRFVDLVPPVLRRAAAIITVSEFSRHELASWMPEVTGRIHVIHPGPRRRSRPSPSTGLAPGPPYVLTIGIDPRKNPRLLLDAFSILQQRGVDLRLVLAGPPSPLLDVEAMVAERGLRDVVMTGFVDDARAAALLGNASVFAWPSTYEGFGLPLVEAMQAGVPVVGSRAGPTPEVVGDAAVVVDPSPEAFADALQRAATDTPLRDRLVSAGFQRAALFDWDRAARATRDVYRSVV